MTPVERVLARTRTEESGCVVFLGAKSPTGYGFVRVNGKNEYTHRVVYAAKVEPIADGLVIDHLCRNRACVNPDHLEAVTVRENTLRGESIQARNARKTHCLNSHELSGDNLRVDPTGRRICRTCKRETQRKLRAA